jgi:spermidine synthase
MSEKFKVIYSINSEINGLLKVVDTPSGRELRSSKDLIVTLSEKHKFFSKRYWGIYLEELRKLRPTYKKALCIGLGGGAIQNELFKMYPGIEILSIEIDPIMNDIHNFYFSGDQNSNHKILNLDANVFLKYPRRFGAYEKYFDLIFVDVFSGMGVAEFSKVSNIFEKTKDLLKQNGIFSMNVIVQKEEQFEESLKHIETLKLFYSDIKLVYTGSTLGVVNLEIFSSDKINL